MMLVIFCCDPSDAADPTTPIIRIAFSRNVMVNINENDAMAALKVWAQTLVQMQGLAVNPEPQILETGAELVKALNKKAVDCINVTTLEYTEISRQLSRKHVVLGMTSDSITEEYVLLVHRNSDIKQLNDLQGRTMAFFRSRRMNLGAPWLETILARAALGPARNFLGKIIPTSKIVKAVIPVFFGQMEACLVTRKGFETMIRLNPQTGEQLKVLVASPPIVPGFFCFRVDYDAHRQKQIMKALSCWHLNPAGRQILTLFQIDRLIVKPLDCLDHTLELLTEYRRWYPRLHKYPSESPPE